MPDPRLRFGDFPLPVLGLAARSGTGKTTLLTRLIPALREAGVRVAVIKHSHHDIELDRPGKDSHRLREAGADQVMLASPYRSFWVGEGDGQTLPPLPELLARLDVGRIELVLLEGYRHLAHARIEVYRAACGNPPLAPDDPHVIAVAADSALDLPLPVLPLNDTEAVRDFVLGLLNR